MDFPKPTVFGFLLLFALRFVTSQESTTELFTTATPTVVTSIPDTTVKPTSPPTTEPPSTTTVPSSTTSKPLPELGSWNITSGNVTCIRAELQIGFNINLGGVKESFPLSPEASDSKSNCDAPNGTQVLALSYKNYEFTLIFANDSSNAYVEHTVLAYQTEQGEDIFYNSSKLFMVKVGNSYQCKTTDTIHLGNETTIDIYHIHLQAFGTAEEDGFSTAEECVADDKVSDVIPIAVACALAGLIVVVLIAYLVGRRRSRQKGYTSV